MQASTGRVSSGDSGPRALHILGRVFPAQSLLPHHSPQECPRGPGLGSGSGASTPTGTGLSSDGLLLPGGSQGPRLRAASKAPGCLGTFPKSAPGPRAFLGNTAPSRVLPPPAQPALLGRRATAHSQPWLCPPTAPVSANRVSCGCRGAPRVTWPCHLGDPGVPSADLGPVYPFHTGNRHPLPPPLCTEG